MLEHLLGDGEVCDHAVLERANGLDVGRRAAEHPLGVQADRDHALVAVAVVANRDDRRLVENDALLPRIDQRVRRTQIDREVPRETSAEELQAESR